MRLNNVKVSISPNRKTNSCAAYDKRLKTGIVFSKMKRNGMRDNFWKFNYLKQYWIKLPRYEYLTESHAELFKFTSEGPKGSIKKIVVYTEMLEEDIYNLAFGDFDEETDSINDKSITGNNDKQKVLSTVASTLYVFTEKYPNIWVYATGSNAAGTRLYRMGITTNLEEIMDDFDVHGLSDEIWIKFEKEKIM